MKKKIISIVCILCAGALIGDYCYSNRSIEQQEYTMEDGTCVAGIVSETQVAMEDIPVVTLVNSFAFNVAADGTFCGYTNIGICNVSEGNLNVREEATKDSKIVGKLPKNGACEILGYEDEWMHISSGEVEGYVMGEYILEGTPAYEAAQEIASYVAKSTTDHLNVREEPNTDCKVIASMSTDTELDVIEDMGEWIKVDVNEEIGYVFSEFVEVSLQLPHAKTITEIRYGDGVSDIRVEICDYAMQFIGNPYVWGGTSLTKGCDCSGYVMQIYGKYGFNFPHSSRAQANYGRKIDPKDAQPGDLFFYPRTGYNIGHVGIYIGGGKIVNAYNSKQGITITNAYYRTPTKVMNVLD